MFTCWWDATDTGRPERQPSGVVLFQTRGSKCFSRSREETSGTSHLCNFKVKRWNFSHIDFFSWVFWMVKQFACSGHLKCCLWVYPFQWKGCTLHSDINIIIEYKPFFSQETQELLCINRLLEPEVLFGTTIRAICLDLGELLWSTLQLSTL